MAKRRKIPATPIIDATWTCLVVAYGGGERRRRREGRELEARS
jgi:hypothetical protein